MENKANANALLTPKAEDFVRRMMRFTRDPRAGLRLKIRPGGCSGLAVEFDLANEPEAKEMTWEYAGLRIFLDSSSLLLLDGATVDFRDSLAQSGFVVTAASGAAQACSSASTLVPIGSLVRH